MTDSKQQLEYGRRVVCGFISVLFGIVVWGLYNWAAGLIVFVFLFFTTYGISGGFDD